MECPVNAAENLGDAYGAGEVGAFRERVHQFAPGFGAFLPCFGVVARVNDGHDAIADQDHGSEVLCSFWASDKHRY